MITGHQIEANFTKLGFSAENELKIHQKIKWKKGGEVSQTAKQIKSEKLLFKKIESLFSTQWDIISEKTFFFVRRPENSRHY